MGKTDKAKSREEVRVFRFLARFFRRIIFERGRHVVPPEEEGGYIVPEIWSTERKKLKTVCISIICINCQFYNENWQKEWSQKEYSWCKRRGIGILNDKKSQKLGYCKDFIWLKNRGDKPCLKK